MQEKRIAEVTRSPKYSAIGAVIRSWANSRTDPTLSRRHYQIRNKVRIVAEFFSFCGNLPEKVVPKVVKLWQVELVRKRFVLSTIYAKISKISSFYKWMMKDPDLSNRIKKNPVTLARSRAPKAYQ